MTWCVILLEAQGGTLRYKGTTWLWSSTGAQLVLRVPEGAEMISPQQQPERRYEQDGSIQTVARPSERCSRDSDPEEFSSLRLSGVGESG